MRRSSTHSAEVTKLQSAYLPMSETAYYILLSLVEPLHGYGIMQLVENVTKGRIRLGPGTLYGTLSRMEKDGLIESVAEVERRKIYQITAIGLELLRLEMDRLEELLTNGQKRLEGHE